MSDEQPQLLLIEARSAPTPDERMMLRFNRSMTPAEFERLAMVVDSILRAGNLMDLELHVTTTVVAGWSGEGEVGERDADDDGRRH